MKIQVLKMVTEQELKNWYNRKHAEKGENAWRPAEAYPFFLDLVKVQPGRKILDIGCGTGFLLQEAAKRGLETYGIDISEEAAKIVRRVSPASEITAGSGENLKYPGEFFDYVFCLGALEHFVDMEKGLREMIRVGKADAFFCVMVPNIDCFFWKNSVSRGTDQQDISERLMSLREWRQFFVREGLEITNVDQDRWFVRDIRIFASANPIGIIKRTAYKMFLPLRYAYQFIFIMKKN